MTSRRNFVKTSLLAGLASTSLPIITAAEEKKSIANKKWKHWLWINPQHSDNESDLRKAYARYFKAGIKGIFFEEDSEKHFRAAKAEKLEAHRWMWTMNRREKSLLDSHPEWYSINRKGESSSNKPAYVDYYRWLCPSKPEVHKYLEDDVKRILSKDYVDGIHLDYVRFCDVILPVNLWDNYKIEQTKELPEYDYCYCNDCKRKFKEWRGQDLDSIKYPEASLSWRQFRYDAITTIVNKLAKVAQSNKKPITAAVFPTPEVARRNVRQDWVNWNLSGVCPMIYHGFYKENVEWIGDAVAEGVRGLHGRFPLYAGLFIPDFKNQQELQQGIKFALANGAAGVSLFGNVTEEVLRTLEQSSALI